jgi:hypothetical protein
MVAQMGRGGGRRETASPSPLPVEKRAARRQPEIGRVGRRVGVAESAEVVARFEVQ